MSDEHDKEVRTYLLVFASLAVLTLMTVGVAYMNLPGAMGVIIAIVIALAKVTLIGAFFMHLRDEGKFINFSLGVCVMLILVLLLFVMPDLGLVEEELSRIQTREVDAHAHYTGLQGNGSGAEGGH